MAIGFVVTGTPLGYAASAMGTPGRCTFAGHAQGIRIEGVGFAAPILGADAAAWATKVELRGARVSRLRPDNGHETLPHGTCEIIEVPRPPPDSGLGDLLPVKPTGDKHDFDVSLSFHRAHDTAGCDATCVLVEMSKGNLEGHVQEGWGACANLYIHWRSVATFAFFPTDEALGSGVATLGQAYSVVDGELTKITLQSPHGRLKCDGAAAQSDLPLEQLVFAKTDRVANELHVDKIKLTETGLEILAKGSMVLESAPRQAREVEKTREPPSQSASWEWLTHLSATLAVALAVLTGAALLVYGLRERHRRGKKNIPSMEAIPTLTEVEEKILAKLVLLFPDEAHLRDIWTRAVNPSAQGERPLGAKTIRQAWEMAWRTARDGAAESPLRMLDAALEKRPENKELHSLRAKLKAEIEPRSRISNDAEPGNAGHRV